MDFVNSLDKDDKKNMLKTIIHGQMQTKLHIEMLKDTKGIP